MSAHEGLDPEKKHRHDVGLPDHAATSTLRVTQTIQVLLGICIVLSAALMVYALVHAGFEVAAPVESLR